MPGQLYNPNYDPHTGRWDRNGGGGVKARLRSPCGLAACYRLCLSVTLQVCSMTYSLSVRAESNARRLTLTCRNKVTSRQQSRQAAPHPTWQVRAKSKRPWRLARRDCARRCTFTLSELTGVTCTSLVTGESSSSLSGKGRPTTTTE